MASTITADTGAVSGSAGLKQSADSSGILALATGTGTTAVTIDASQNVGIGTASPSSRLHVYDNVVVFTVEGQSTSSASIQFKTNSTNRYKIATPDSSADLAFYSGGSTERMRLDTSGNLLVGTTSNTSFSARLCMSYNSGTTNWAVGPWVSTPTNFYISGNGLTNGVYLNGVTATTWSGLSDERAKDIIEPISDAANKVLSLRAVIGKYKTDEDGVRRSFLIAQDVQAVLPEAVSIANPENGYLGVAYTDVIPLLTAAIQEQQALITTLTERITALEAK